MRVLLLSTSTSRSYFSSLIKEGNTPNPSNQHFYRLFIEMLSLKYPVDILSYRPITNKNIKKYPYLKESEENIYFFSCNTEENDVMFFIMLNTNCVYLK